MAETNTATAGASEDVKNQQGQEAESNEKNVKEATKKTEQPKQITITEEELEKMKTEHAQAEADRRVAQAEKTFEKRFEKELREKIEEERQDAERLAKLTAEEREKELFERNRSLLEDKEKTLRQREMKLAAIDVLNEEGLPVTFADQLLGESVDDTHDRIQKFKKAWHEAIDSEVSKRLKSKIPEGGGTKGDVLDMNKIIRRGFKRG